jgi:hypothetical protein
MHPIIPSEIAKAQVADLLRKAERDRLARTVRLARKDHSRPFAPGHLTIVLARRVVALLGARSLRPAKDAPKATS